MSIVIRGHGVKVLCASCGEPIKADHLGGIIKVDGKDLFFHDNIVCYQEVMKRKEEADS